jgi:hypothetical protein
VSLEPITRDLLETDNNARFSPRQVDSSRTIVSLPAKRCMCIVSWEPISQSSARFCTERQSAWQCQHFSTGHPPRGVVPETMHDECFVLYGKARQRNKHVSISSVYCSSCDNVSVNRPFGASTGYYWLLIPAPYPATVARFRGRIRPRDSENAPLLRISNSEYIRLGPA